MPSELPTKRGRGMTSGKRYVVAQAPKSGVWLHYLCGWHGPENGTASGGRPSNDDMQRLPVFLGDRKQALRFDESTARRIADQLNSRYRNIVRTYAEELLLP